MATDKISFRLPSRLIEKVNAAKESHDGKISAVIVAALDAYLPSEDVTGQHVGGTVRDILAAHEARISALESGTAAGEVKRSAGKRPPVNQTVAASEGYDEDKTRDVINAVRAQCIESGARFTHGAAAKALNAEGLKTYAGFEWDNVRVKTFIQRYGKP